MPAATVPAAPAIAPFMNVLPDRKLSSDSIMGCRLYHSQCPWSRKMFHLDEKRTTQKRTHSVMAISLPLRSECIACWLWITKLPAQSFNCSALRFHADVSGCSVTEDCVTQHETSHDTVLKNGAVPLEIL